MTNSYTISYNTRPTEFSNISKNLGSDKGSPVTGEVFANSPRKWYYHHYTDFYEQFFGPWRKSVKGIFECGLGTNNLRFQSNMGLKGVPGASLRMWETLFPNADIYGADIDKDILFNENRIKTFYVDQTDADSVAALSNLLPKDLDIIIDDGLHSGIAAISLYKGLHKNLRAGGVYIIEDVWSSDLPNSMRDSLEKELVSLGVEYSVIEFSNEEQRTALIMIINLSLQ